MECAICFENMSFWNSRSIWPCKHRYHTRCLQEFFCYSKNPLCALCRQSIESVYVPFFSFVSYTPHQFLKTALIERYKHVTNCVLFIETWSLIVSYKLPTTAASIRTFLFSHFFMMYIRHEIRYDVFIAVYWEFIMSPKVNHRYEFPGLRLFIVDDEYNSHRLVCFQNYS